MIRIICPNPTSFSEIGLDFARRYATVFSREMTQKEFEDQLSSYDAALIRFNTQVTERVMKNCSLKSILSPTTGLDHIDLDAAERFKIRLFHLRGQEFFLKQVHATAEHTVALLLAVLRNIPEAFQAVKSWQWSPGPFRGLELSGKMLGIIGYGRLGRKVARICQAFGMRIIIFDPYIQNSPSFLMRASSLDELLESSDVISLHVPLLPETKHMIGKREFSIMRDGAIIVNTSRGAVIDSNALLDALSTKKLLAAALDVLENEDLIEQQNHNILINYARFNPNLLITPHIGGSTIESIEKTDLFILRRYFKEMGIKL